MTSVIRTPTQNWERLSDPSTSRLDVLAAMGSWFQSRPEKFDEFTELVTVKIKDILDLQVPLDDQDDTEWDDFEQEIINQFPVLKARYECRWPVRLYTERIFKGHQSCSLPQARVKLCSSVPAPSQALIPVPSDDEWLFLMSSHTNTCLQAAMGPAHSDNQRFQALLRSWISIAKAHLNIQQRIEEQNVEDWRKFRAHIYDSHPELETQFVDSWPVAVYIERYLDRRVSNLEWDTGAVDWSSILDPSHEGILTRSKLPRPHTGIARPEINHWTSLKRGFASIRANNHGTVPIPDKEEMDGIVHSTALNRQLQEVMQIPQSGARLFRDMFRDIQRLAKENLDLGLGYEHQTGERWGNFHDKVKARYPGLGETYDQEWPLYAFTQRSLAQLRKRVQSRKRERSTSEELSSNEEDPDDFDREAFKEPFAPNSSASIETSISEDLNRGSFIRSEPLVISRPLSRSPQKSKQRPSESLLPFKKARLMEVHLPSPALIAGVEPSPTYTMLDFFLFENGLESLLPVFVRLGITSEKSLRRIWGPDSSFATRSRWFNELCSTGRIGEEDSELLKAAIFYR